jgi:hypothetical protein
MAKIFIPAIDDYREIDQIVSFGCSMTQGAELLDNERFPEVKDIEAFKKGLGNKWHEWKRNSSLTRSQDLAIDAKESMIAWPGQLAKIYKVPCINYAEPASSFEKQISQFMRAHQRKQITPTTLVIWGFTSKERGIWIQKERFTGWLLNNVMIPDNKFPSEDVELFWMNRVNSDMMLLWKYYMCMQTVFSLAEGICNDQFMFVQSLKVNFDYDTMPPWEKESVDRTEFIETIRGWWKIINPKYQKYRIFNDDSKHVLLDWAQQNKLCLTGYHPTLEGHKLYARLIDTELNNRSKL